MISKIPQIFHLFLMLLIISTVFSSTANAYNDNSSGYKSSKVDIANEKLNSRIAVMDFDTQDLSRSTGVMAADLMRTNLSNEKCFTVIERGRINLIIKEYNFQQTGLTDKSKAIELGRLLAANKILTGTVMKLGEQIVITVRLLDVESGRIDCGGKETVHSVEGLNTATEKLSHKIAGYGSRVTGSATQDDTAEVPVDIYSPDYKSPAIAGAMALIPCCSGSFYAYNFDINQFPGTGIFLACGKTAAFATGGVDHA